MFDQDGATLWTYAALYAGHSVVGLIDQFALDVATCVCIVHVWGHCTVRPKFFITMDDRHVNHLAVGIL
jgi:hypothetical protein